MKALRIETGEVDSVGVVFPQSKVRVEIRRDGDVLSLESGVASLTLHDLIVRLDSRPSFMVQAGLREFPMRLNWSLGGSGWPSIDTAEGVTALGRGNFGVSTILPALNCVLSHRIGRTALYIDEQEVLRLSPSQKILDTGNVSGPDALIASALCLYSFFERAAGCISGYWNTCLPFVSTDRRIQMAPAVRDLYTLQMRSQRKRQYLSRIPPR